MKKALADLKVEIFADGADLGAIRELAAHDWIRGFTTNPTLMRKAGVPDYKAFALSALEIVQDRPVSFEVFADEPDEMERQARQIASWGDNVNVKIPVTNTRGEFCGPVIKRLSADGIQVNVTALFTLDQVHAVTDCLARDVFAIVSVFAGRIADTGIDPLPMLAEAVSVVGERPAAKLLWASPREVLNVRQADGVGCHIITLTSDAMAKLRLFGKDLNEFSLETVAMFYNDAAVAGYTID